MTASSPEAAAPAILVVEDDPLLGAKIKSLLEHLCFSVSGVATTAREALSLGQISMPRLALIDSRLAGPVSAADLAVALQRLGIATIFMSGAANAP
jgi:two-component system, response regulator PdtaR